MKRVALYTRVSTAEQKNHGLSLDRQLEVLRRYAQEHKYLIVGEYTDAGISAHIPYKKRPSLMRMLSDIEQDRIDLVLFIKLDRFTRQVGAYYDIMKVFEAHNVSWCATEEDYETETSSGRFKVNILLSVAQDEAERASERIKFVLDGKREKGQFTGGHVLYGYKVENGYAVVDEEKAKIVRKVFQKFIELRSLSKVLESVQPEWDTCVDYICHMLQNDKYIGNGIYPPIVDKGTFKVVQGIYASAKPRAKRKSRIYLFQGLIHCGECGSLMTPRYFEGYRTYYICTKGNIHRCPNTHCIKESDVEKFLLDNLLSEIRSLKVSSVKTDIKKDRARLLTRQEKLKDLYLNDLIDKEIYTKEYSIIQKDIEELQIEESNQGIDYEYYENALSLYDELTAENKARFWHSIIQRIDYLKGNFSFTLVMH